MVKRDQTETTQELTRNLLGERLVKIDVVAKMFGVEKSTIRDWINQGDLMAIKFGKAYYISETALRESKKSKEQQQRRELQARQDELERRAELSRRQGRDPAVHWNETACLWCGISPVFTTRNQRLDGDICCGTCQGVDGKKPEITKDWLERQVRLRVDELNREIDELLSPNELEARQLLIGRRWREPHGVYTCPLCDRPGVVARRDLKDQSFVLDCDHTAPFSVKRRYQSIVRQIEAVTGEAVFAGVPWDDRNDQLARHPVMIGYLAELEAEQWCIEMGEDPEDGGGWNVCICASCKEVLAVATAAARMVGETLCRRCRHQQASPTTAGRLSVIAEWLRPAGSPNGIVLESCGRAGCSVPCGILDYSSVDSSSTDEQTATQGPLLMLSGCLLLSHEQREKQADEYADICGLTQDQRRRLEAWIVEGVDSELSFINDVVLSDSRT